MVNLGFGMEDEMHDAKRLGVAKSEDRILVTRVAI